MRIASLLLALALLCGCSSGTGTPVATHAPLPVETTTEATPSPTATPTPSATPTPTPTARRRPALDGDVDGDGTVDSLRATSTRLTVELSGSGRSVSTAVHADGPSSPAVLGSFDVDRDGYAEVFLETAQGASTSFATPYRFDGTSLTELRLDDGPARLGIGGSVTHGDGFRCLRSGLLEVRSADSEDGNAYTVHADSYRLARSELVLVSSTTSKATQGDPAVEDSYRVSCGSVGDG